VDFAPLPPGGDLLALDFQHKLLIYRIYFFLTLGACQGIRKCAAPPNFVFFTQHVAENGKSAL